MTRARLVGQVDPGQLSDARIALHWAALLAANVGRSLAPRQPGFRNAALSWNQDRRALVGAEVESPRGGLLAGVCFEPPSLALLPSTGPAIGELQLNGVAIEATWTWIAAMIEEAGIHANALTMRLPRDPPKRPKYDRLVVDGAASAELGRWFSLGNERLAEAAAARNVTLPVPCWPDHFDLAVVVHVPGVSDPQVTLGFSPGDPTIEEPYLYVLPWPEPRLNVAETPAPAGGRWQLEGWTGLALVAHTLVTASDPAALAAAFYEQGFELARDLLAR